MTHDVPNGIVTFLFTDLEGSTRMWEQAQESMQASLQLHDQILRESISERSGVVFSTAGDAFAAAFHSPEDAVAAAADAQIRLSAQPWPESTPIRARMGVHTGHAQLRDGDYFGPTLNRAARLMSAAHGGQTVVSSATQLLVDDARLIDMGEHRLKDLSRPERVWQLVIDGLPITFPPLRTLDAVPTNLPTEVASFVGRETELGMVTRDLERHRLVTLTGVGGVGKTRLAVQAAADVSHHYPGGVWFLALAPLKVPDAVPFRLLEAMSLEAEPSRSPVETAASAIGTDEVLLLVDNCEHVIDAASELIGTLLAACPNLKLLAASRLPLEIGGEHVRQVLPLGVGGDGAGGDDRAGGGAAVALFIDRALAAGADTSISDRSEAIERICRRVDGVPLAIELAAARTRSMTPEDLETRLDERINVLKGPRGSEERHQTLRSTIDWSYQLLDDQQKLLFQRLAVFAGSFALEAAEAICADEEIDAFDIVDLLDDLVRHSLLAADVTRATTRYRMLESLQEFAAEQLGDSLGHLKDRHVQYHVRWVASIARQLRTREEAAGLERLEAGWSDLRAATIHATGDLDLLAELVMPLAFDAVFRTRLEIADWSRAALLVADSEPPSIEARVALLTIAATVLGLGGYPDEAVERAAELVEVCETTGTPIPLGSAGATMAGVLLTGNIDLMNRIQALMEVAATDADDPWDIGITSVFRAIAATYSGDPDRARAASRASLSQLPADLAPSYRALAGWMAAVTSEEPRPLVVERMERVVEQATLVRSSFLRAVFTQYLASVRSEVGDLSQSMRDAAANIEDMLAAKSHGLATATARRAAALLITAGSHAAGATILGWVDSRDSIPPTGDLAAQLETLVPTIAEALGPDAEVAARDRGAELSLESVMSFAVDELLAAAA